LLSQNNKLLSHILVKGYRNTSTHLVAWLTEIMQSINIVFYLLNMTTGYPLFDKGLRIDRAISLDFEKWTYL
jgi:hypothetical protein